ncbi:hypothetical protein NQZ68_013077 [Dissostichus eleginoides]|nr:hypothetical protein NQZ68_013077 [Dissostichus eleginoides]
MGPNEVRSCTICELKLDPKELMGTGGVAVTFESVALSHMTEQLAESGLIWNCHQPLVKCSVRVGREHGSMRSQPIHNQTLGTVRTSCRQALYCFQMRKALRGPITFPTQKAPVTSFT